MRSSERSESLFSGQAGGSKGAGPGLRYSPPDSVIQEEDEEDEYEGDCSESTSAPTETREIV